LKFDRKEKEFKKRKKELYLKENSGDICLLPVDELCRLHNVKARGKERKSQKER
jgi:hypothetical protein